MLEHVGSYTAPDKIEYLELPADHPLILLAQQYAARHSLDKNMPNCSVIYRDGKVLGIGANGSDHHEKHGCERVRLGCKTGQGYELCEGCHPKNHGERRAIADMKRRGNAGEGAVNIMFGHYWACGDCWKCLRDEGVETCYVLQGSLYLFDKNDPRNAVGRQFELCGGIVRGAQAAE